MKTAQKTQLMDELARYGYSLVQTETVREPEDVLTSLLTQDDSRLLEGFPVVLASALKQKQTLSWEAAGRRAGRLLSQKAKRRLTLMLTLSYLLFELYGMPQDFGRRVLKIMSKLAGAKKAGELVQQCRGPFSKSEPVKMDDVELSTERLKNHFRSYVVHAPESAESQKKKHVLELELLLSELFTARQKELLKKRLERKAMSKTEREYFYRVVKKRLRALACEELHQMARDLLTH